MFSMSVATLPGASPSALPAGGGFSATVAFAAIEPYLDQLSPEQRSIVDGFDGTVIASTEPGSHQLVDATGTTDATSTGAGTGITTAGTPTTGQTPPGTGAGGSNGTSTTGRMAATGTTTATSQPPATTTAPITRAPAALRLPRPQTLGPSAHDTALFQQTLDDWVAYRPDLMDRVTGGFRLAVSTKEPKNGAEMDTRMEKGTKTCRVTMYPVYTDGDYKANTAKYVFAHELFHCVQFTWSTLSDDQEWLVEGSAEFAALDLYRETFQPIATESYQDWFTDPGRALGQEPEGRGYGDWALFEAFKKQYNTDPYPAIREMISRGGTVGQALTAGHFDNEIFETLWPSTSLRSTSYPDGIFQLKWPGVQPDYGKQNTAKDLGSRGVGTYPVIGKGGFAHPTYTAGFTSAVGIISVVPKSGPLLTRANAGPVTVGEGQQAWFCVRSGGCTCPNGTAAPDRLIPLTPPMLFSFAAQPDKPSATVTALPWDPNKYCHADNPPTDRAVGGSANGDPHVITYNGLHYDFMTYGEFLTSTDPAGGFTVQERHVQAGFGTAISAVAVGDGTHRITLTAQQIAGTAPITVEVDGQVTTATTLTTGGLSLTDDSTDDEPSWTIGWPDGSAVNARWADGFFLTVVPAAARRPHLQGLLGTPATTFLADLSLPDGTRADPTDGYAGFVAAYRVTSGTTLFDYEPGQSPDSFARPPATVPSVITPTAQVLAGCRSGLPDQATASEIEDCAYDITSLGGQAVARYTRAYADVTDRRAGQIVDRPDRSPASPIVVGSAAVPSASGTDTSQVPAPGLIATAPSAQAGGTPWLTLAGTIQDWDAAGFGRPEPALTGSIQLPKDTVLVIKTQCQPTAYLSVKVALHDGSYDPPSITPFVCDPHFQPSNDAHDTTANGEHEVMITTAGVYDLKVTTNSPTAFRTAVSFYADPTPTVLPLPNLQSKGFSGTLSGIGDTVLATVKTDQGASWKLTGGGTLCRAFNYAFVETDRGPTDIGADCWHNPDPQVGIGPGGPVPYLIFSTDPGSQQISLVPVS